jgi:hypothetical protein
MNQFERFLVDVLVAHIVELQVVQTNPATPIALGQRPAHEMFGGIERLEFTRVP